jgi:caa(3)-type oxidase subunit IV
MAKSPLAAAAAHGAHDPHDISHHVHPVSMYVKTAMLLAALMGLTIFAALPQFPIPMPLWIANILALGIAATKAFFVVWNFMHVKWASSLGKLWAFIGFFYLIVLATILIDYVFRHHEVVPGWEGARRESALPRQVGSTDGLALPADEINVQNRNAKG